MDYDSSHEYYIVLDKGKEVYGTNQNKLQKEGILIKYFRNTQKVDSVFLGKGSIIIDSYIDKKDVVFDKKFIILKQKPLNKICECKELCLERNYSSKGDFPTYKMCAEAIKESVFYQYWIIDKIKNNIYGPLTKEEFLVKKRELRVELEF
jgi:hypothetical protein